MKNTLKLNHDARTIIMDKTFTKFAADTRSAEYSHLQQVRQDYPLYTVVQRHIRKNTRQEHYHGLTYRYMEDYIATHGSKEDRRIYDEMRLISQCHSRAYRYPTIKAWFLERFPEIKEFGVRVESDRQEAAVSAESVATITELPVSA